MTDIYDQHKAAFANVSAFVVLDSRGERVATVALKFPRDGAGRLWAYVHLIGVSMVRGYASGYGYDKRSAAVSAAIPKIAPYGKDYGDSEFSAKFEANRQAFRSAADDMGGREWTHALEARGFRVLQAV